MVDARCISGRSLLLDVDEDTSLGAVQKTLCAAFGQKFPAIKASITVGETTYDEFIQTPFRTCGEGGVVHVTFSQTDDPLFYDLLDRKPKHAWLR